MPSLVSAAAAVGCTLCALVARAQLCVSIQRNAHDLRHAHEPVPTMTPMVMRRP